MSAAPPTTTDEESSEAPPTKGGRKMLILIAAAVALLLAAGAGLWFTGILPGLFGLKKDEHAQHEAGKAGPPSYVDLPEMVANLNGARKPAYIKVLVRIEVAKAEDAEKVKAATPRLQDLFQTYLREIRPEELRGSAGAYRLREELIARANIAIAPSTISDVLFTQLLVQ
jgi:flagellar protein FliL